MRSNLRRRLEMAVRARNFCRANPSTAEAQTAILARLDELLRRADALKVEERTSRLEELASTIRRQTLRRAIQLELLPHLVRVGQLAGKDNPALAGKFNLRSPQATHTSFLTSTRLMLDLGKANAAELVSRGLSDNLLPELDLAVSQFEEAMTTGQAGRGGHVRARENLADVARQAAAQVEQLDGLNRFRFRGDPGLLKEWEAVRLVGPRQPPEPAGLPAGPPAGEVAA